MADCKPHLILCEMGITKTSGKVDFIDNKPFREIFGNLIYIIVATSPDNCYKVTKLSQDLTKLNSFHLTKAKHVLC